MKALATLLILLLGTGLRITAQDTVTVMHYNLLNYGNTTTYCTQTNNSIVDKAAAMGVIASYVQPDILMVNEMGSNSFASGHFLSNVLNINGVNYYQVSTLTNVSGGDLANFLFYDGRKWVLKSQYAIPTSVRDINVFKLYHNDPNLPVHQDTAFLFVISTHLKAGNTSADAADRAAMAKIIMDSSVYWTGYPAILSGDFNLYTSTEHAWKNLTAPLDTTIERFHDPINMSGSWQNNQTYAGIHTQSTHSSSNGCAASGGLDDRFDFILMNEVLNFNSPFFAYIPGTYKSVGNDGNHLNLSINAGTNNSAPSAVIQALYDASDHLPVVMKLLLTPSTQGITAAKETTCMTAMSYRDGTLKLQFQAPVTLKEVTIFDLTGREITRMQSGSEYTTTHTFHPNCPILRGCFIVKATDQQGRIHSGKILM